MKTRMAMQGTRSNKTGLWMLLVSFGVVTTGTLSTGVALADEPARFDSPDAALKAVVEVFQAKEKGGLSRIFGTISKDLLSGDDVQDKADLTRFAKRLADSAKWSRNDDGSMTLLVGFNEYPFPIPLVQKDGKWSFDTVAGMDEILNRRIGDNELSTIDVCRGMFVAQREYYLADRDGDEVVEYAQRFSSTPGKRDGLYWETKQGETPSPLGPLAAQAASEGYGAKGDAAKPATTDGGPKPYHGYLFRLLTSQGEKAPGGKMNYLINGHMVAGFALVAYPVDYGSSGIMTFIMNSNGQIYQKDLGQDTAKVAGAMQSYDRDESWTPVK